MEECQSNWEARERTLPSNILAVIEIQKEEPKSYCTIASEHVSLIVAQPETTATSNDEEPKKSKTPPINVLTVWFVAFCEQYFDPMFDWVMRDCPVLGSWTYGQTSCLCPKRAFIMHQQLTELENGKWRENPAFVCRVAISAISCYACRENQLM